MLTIVSFAGVLILLILVHEFGHFITAKLAGVKVEEFGLGFPPKIFGFKVGETEYTLNMVPLGGFCRLLGEEDPKEKRSLASRNKGIRILVLSAGSLMNLVLPFFLFTASFMVPHPVFSEQVRVESVSPDSPAAAAGIQPGDVILEINGAEVKNRADLTINIRRNLGKEIKLLLKNSQEAPRTVTLVPRLNPPSEQGAIGILLSPPEMTGAKETKPVWEAVPLGIKTTWDTLVLFRNEIAGWFITKQAPEVSGPIGIARFTGVVAQAGLGPLLAFTAIISINLAIVNLLPVPGLDGGRLVFVFLEFFMRGKRISPARERIVHFIGFAMLISLVLLVSYFDVMRLVSGESLLP